MHEIVHGNMDDKATYKMLENGNTVGIFQLSSKGMQALFQRMHPTSFDDIMASVALYRPGPMDMNAHVAYAERKSGNEPDYVINENMNAAFAGSPVEEILKPTHGLCVYQEQVMRISINLSGFSWKEADILRKGMGHKIMSVLNEMGPKFIEGSIDKSHIDKEHSEKLWEYLRAFGEYGFNKSHSASYGMISYETAWLKCHYPAEFMAAVITDKFRNSKSPEDKTDIIKETREMGLKVSSVDINNSGIGMTAVKKKHDDEPDIVFGLSGVKGLSESFANELIEAREEHGGEFDSVDDFMRNIPLSLVSKKTIDGLGGAGGFDTFHISRRAIVVVAEDMANYYKSEGKSRQQGKRSLFDDLDDEDSIDESFRIPDIEDWDWITRLDQEEERLGAIISGHPMSNLGDGLEFLKMGYLYKPDRFGQVITVDDAVKMDIKATTGRNGSKWYDSIPVRIIASLDSATIKNNKKGEKIMTGMMEDVYSSLSYRVLPDAMNEIMKTGTPLHNHVYIIKGELTKDWNDSMMLKAFGFDEVSLSASGMIPIWFRMSSSSINSKGYEKLIDLLSKSENKGDIPVIINTKNPKTMNTSEVDTGCNVRYSPELEQQCEKLLGVKRFGRWDR
jgi:DNA polymerase-3 subunit alpha